MKIILKSITAITLIGMLSLFNGCAKDGKDGAPGPTGSAGTNGNANVKSETFMYSPSSWQLASNTYFINRTTTLITSDIVTSGAILVYMQSTTSTSWQALPYTWPNGTQSQIYRFWYNTNNLKLEIYSEDLTPSVSTNLTFKLVAISSSARLSNPHIDFNDYYQVKAAFDLKD